MYSGGRSARSSRRDGGDRPRGRSRTAGCSDPTGTGAGHRRQSVARRPAGGRRSAGSAAATGPDRPASRRGPARRRRGSRRRLSSRRRDMRPTLPARHERDTPGANGDRCLARIRRRARSVPWHRNDRRPCRKRDNHARKCAVVPVRSGADGPVAHAGRFACVGGCGPVRMSAPGARGITCGRASRPCVALHPQPARVNRTLPPTLAARTIGATTGPRTTKAPQCGAFRGADEGTRTLDLRHGKATL